LQCRASPTICGLRTLRVGCEERGEQTLTRIARFRVGVALSQSVSWRRRNLMIPFDSFVIVVQISFLTNCRPLSRFKSARHRFGKVGSSTSARNGGFLESYAWRNPPTSVDFPCKSKNSWMELRLPIQHPRINAPSHSRRATILACATDSRCLIARGICPRPYTTNWWEAGEAGRRPRWGLLCRVSFKNTESHPQRVHCRADVS